ncbi:MAG: carbamoyl phosphate synthase small subunit [Clostridia bacterium]|nr:carbamoyl phosphate synthase small subunit [Clostridia bacterium]
MKKKKVYLTLQNGRVFQGYSFGAEGEVSGELVFNTGMVGYIEALSDPCNQGQILMQTFPLIGNYGMVYSDVEGKKASVSAYVVREICDEPSNFRMEGKLENYLKEQNVVGIYGVDTRQLTKILREEGTMNARISLKPLTEAEIKALANHRQHAHDFSQESFENSVCREGNTKYITLWNFGAKNSTIEKFLSLGYNVMNLRGDATAEEILASGGDGIVISEGPGNPNDYAKSVEEIKKVLGKKPIFGLGLGHQLVALALGAKVEKHKYGHRGGNQPVKCLESGKVYISTQNHGYVVINDSVKAGTVNFINVNDGTCEGIEYNALKAITVQFTPDCCDIGNAENPIYAKFFSMMEEEKENA